jgi:hypothetical protein
MTESAFVNDIFAIQLFHGHAKSGLRSHYFSATLYISHMLIPVSQILPQPRTDSNRDFVVHANKARRHYSRAVESFVIANSLPSSHWPYHFYIVHVSKSSSVSESRYNT